MAAAPDNGPPYYPPRNGIPQINGRIPIDHRYAGKMYPAGVRFTKHVFPILTLFSSKRLKILSLTGNRRFDEKLANKIAGLRKTPRGFIWHHVEDGLTMELLPEEIHKSVRHTGGAIIIKNGGFDK